MQNHLGFIKVGRSTRVEHRRRSLEVADECTIRLVAVVEGAGEFEETMLFNLDEHRLIGEWFEGDDLCRACVEIEVASLSEALGREPRKLMWPYPLADDAAADDWIKRCEDRRALVSINNAYGRQIASMKEAEPTEPDPSRYHDVALWTLLWRFERQTRTIVMPKEGKNDEEVLIGYREGWPDGDIVPYYTTDVAAALLLWPDSDRPKTWSGSAWSCCIEGLKARKTRLAADGLQSLWAHLPSN